MSQQSCPYCLGEITEGQRKTYCSDCGAAHHADCWVESRRCAVLGCADAADPPSAFPGASAGPTEGASEGAGTPAPDFRSQPVGQQGIDPPQMQPADVASAAPKPPVGGPPSAYGGPPYPGPAVQPAAARPGPSANKRTYLAIGILTGAVVFIVLVAVVLTSLGKGKVLEDAVAACDLDSNIYAELGDEGSSLSLDMEGETDFDGLSYDDVSCVLEELEMPDSVDNRMGQTTSMDGMQDASWDGIHASWNYHPDDGLDVILERE